MTGQLSDKSVEGHTPPSLDNLPEFLTTVEAAAVLRCDETYVRRQCKAGAIRATNLRGKAGYRIHRDALREFLGAATIPAARPRPPRGRRRAK